MMSRFLLGFILGCLIMYIGPRKVIVQGIREYKFVTKVAQEEINNDRQPDTGSN